MATLLKDLFTPAFYRQLSHELAQCIPGFKPQAFVQAIFVKGWEDKALKERIRHTSEVLHTFMPADFNKAAKCLVQFVAVFGKDKAGGLPYFFLPDYVEVYGLNDFTAAVKAMETITCFTSCEFAVRPFLHRYPQQMVLQMQQWSKHPHEQVRRLSCEGMRPRLPWAMSVPFLKQDPSVIIPILERLKNDAAETVRRSVANNLNDIAKDHPALVMNLIQQWKGKTPATDWVIKHGSRTLLKKGHNTALAVFGIRYGKSIQLTHCQLLTKKIKMGESVRFRFHLQTSKAQIIRLEYALYFQKANGTLSKKVFKISERMFAKNESLAFERQHAFRPITTRTYYKGLHQVALIVNGKAFEKMSFQLTV